jgi:23S rRNA maturation mini-RNase III
MTDKYATAFEALIGNLYISENTDRLEHIVKRSFEVIEEG